MANLIKVDHGAPNWEDTENANFGTLESDIKGVASVPDWSSDGVTLLNGFTNTSTNPNDTLGYHFYYINGVPKILVLKGKLYAPKGVAAGTIIEVASFPSLVFDFINANRSMTGWWGGTDGKGTNYTLSMNTDKPKLTFSCGVASDDLGWISANKVFIV